MGFGPLARSSINLVDTLAPGAPSITEVVNTPGTHDILVRGINPSADSDGSPLTGLKRRTTVVAPFAEGFNPFDGLSTIEECLLVAGALVVNKPLTDADAGVAFEDKITVGPFGDYGVVSACSDTE